MHRTSRKRIPSTDPSLNCGLVANIVFDCHANQGLAPLPMPLTVLIERIKYLAEQVIVLTKSHSLKYFMNNSSTRGLSTRLSPTKIPPNHRR